MTAMTTITTKNALSCINGWGSTPEFFEVQHSGPCFGFLRRDPIRVVGARKRGFEGGFPARLRGPLGE
jgi:hypothetical protein